MPRLKVLIVDDEPLARRRLSTILGQLPGVENVGEAEDGDEALRLIADKQPEVVLLDIKMPGRGGFEVLENLKGPHIPVVIFVTAFNHYAVRAFEVSAVDYVLKPVAFDRLTSALDKARVALRQKDSEGRLAEMTEVIAALRRESDPAEGQRWDSEIWVQRRQEFVRVAVPTIDWIEAERDYVRLHVGERSYLLREPIGHIEGRLDPDLFVRVHRSALVRRDKITAIRQAGYGALKVQLSTGPELRVGRTYAGKVRELLKA